jgi:serine protease Do
LALIKTEESQMAALPLNLNQPNVGQDVYAIGTPLDESLSTTLSKGVVSNYHIENGQKYIQSDVNVLPGSSGGPLLDSNGNVVGITSNAIFIGQSTTGLNFFIPINEAFSSLSIQ